MRLSLPSALPFARQAPNPWDAVAILCVVGVLITVAQVTREGFVGIDAPGAIEVTLDPWNLPEYAVRTTLRMFAALFLISLTGVALFLLMAWWSKRALGGWHSSEVSRDD